MKKSYLVMCLKNQIDMKNCFHIKAIGLLITGLLKPWSKILRNYEKKNRQRVQVSNYSLTVSKFSSKRQEENGVLFPKKNAEKNKSNYSFFKKNRKYQSTSESSHHLLPCTFCIFFHKWHLRQSTSPCHFKWFFQFLVIITCVGNENQSVFLPPKPSKLHRRNTVFHLEFRRTIYIYIY